MKPDLSSKVISNCGVSMHKGCWSKIGAANSLRVWALCMAIGCGSRGPRDDVGSIWDVEVWNVNVELKDETVLLLEVFFL